MNSAKTHYLPKLEKLMLEKTTLAAPEEKRINNLKFTPFLFLKSSLLWHATEELPSDQGYLYATQALDCITQVESFSRVPVYHGIHLYQKAFCYYTCNQFEQVIHLANVFSNDFKDLIEEQSLIIDVILLAANSMLALGHAERCMEKLEEYLVEYNHHPMLRFEKLVCQKYLAKSKNDLREIVNNLEELLDEMKQYLETNPSLYWTGVPLIETQIKNLNDIIHDPNVEE